jgi:hypothetical protein
MTPGGTTDPLHQVEVLPGLCDNIDDMLMEKVTPRILMNLQRGTSMPSMATSGRELYSLLKGVTWDFSGAMVNFFLAAHSAMG